MTLMTEQRAARPATDKPANAEASVLPALNLYLPDSVFQVLTHQSQRATHRNQKVKGHSHFISLIFVHVHDSK